MANPTTYFGWVMPNSADLVTDLPADFAVFGQGVDTSMQSLLGGTTGQVLSKTSGTNMAFTWINNDTGDITGVTAGTGISGGGTSGTVTVSIDTATTVDKTTAQTLTNKTLTSPALTTPTISTATTNGDILYGTGSGALARLGIGSSAQVLTVTSGIPAWETPSGGGKVLQVVRATYSTATTMTTTTYADTGLTASITPTAATSTILVMITHPMAIYRETNQAGGATRIVRGSTTIQEINSATTGFGIIVGGPSQPTTEMIRATQTWIYTDAPATTSSTTYKTQGKVQSGTNTETIYFQFEGATSQITLLEIGA